MIETVLSSDAAGLETVLGSELAEGDAVAATVAPILRHLLDTDGSSLFSDAVVAAVRGMLADLVRQLFELRCGGPGDAAEAAWSGADGAALTVRLAELTPLVRHLHALALEWQLTQQLQARLALDPVLSPLVLAEIASSDPEQAALAMKLLAAQARFCQDRRRMRLPLAELPAGLRDATLAALEGGMAASDHPPEAEAHAPPADHNRLTLCERLIAGLAQGEQALALTHAGTAIFLTALALGSLQSRDAAALMVNDSQIARLALSLRACGLKQPAVEAAMLAIHPDLMLPEGFDRLSADRAAALLAAAGGRAAD